MSDHPIAQDHPFVRPGQVAPGRAVPDACVKCGQPEEWMRHYADIADSDTSHLELRVTLLEEALVSWRARRRLRRTIRRSAAAYAWVAPSFRSRREEATGLDWIAYGHAGGPAVRPDAMELADVDR